MVTGLIQRHLGGAERGVAAADDAALLERVVARRGAARLGGPAGDGQGRENGCEQEDAAAATHEGLRSSVAESVVESVAENIPSATGGHARAGDLPLVRQALAWWDGTVSRAAEETNRRMLRARDAMDRAYAQPLDVPDLARIAHVSPAHFARTFRATFGETPHRYLQRRRVERAMSLLRETDRSVTDICFEVGFGSPGTFSRTFRDIVGRSPRTYRREAAAAARVPTCFAMAWMRPRE